VGSRVLLVDANETVRAVAARTLVDDGYEVREAATGSGALEEAQRFVPELVVLDPALPDLEGDAVCRALRSTSNLQATPIVITSARDTVLAKERDGVVDGIRKPFTPAALRAVCAHALQRSGEHPTGAADALDVAALDVAAEKLVAHERLVGALASLVAGVTGQARAELEAAFQRLDPTDLLARVERLAAMLPGAADGEWSFAGKIEDLPLGEVLQLLGHQGQSGVLHAIREDGATVLVCLREGRVDLALARDVPEEFLLGRYLVQEGHLDASELRRFVSSTGLLGARLVKVGILTRDDLEAALARQSSELVYEALRWARGRYVFEKHATRPEAREAALGLPMTSIVMEGLRRVDEWRLIEQQVTRFDLVPAVDEAILARTPRERLSAEERIVLDAIDGTRDVAALVAHTQLGSFGVCKVLYQLLTARVVRAD